MVARPAQYQVSAAAGEVSPELFGNTGLKSFYAALSLAERVEPVVQGGFGLLPGTNHRGQIRRGLLLAETIAGNTYAGISTAGDVAVLAFAAQRTVSAVDLKAFKATVKQTARLLRIEVRRVSDLAWVQIGGDFPIDDADRWRRVGFDARRGIVCDQIRLSLTGAPSASLDFIHAGIDILSEPDVGIAAPRLFRFTVDRNSSYVVVATAGHADFYDASGAFTGCAALPLTAGQLASARWLQRSETALLFDTGIKPVRLLRNGVGYDWSSGDAPFEFISQADLGGDYVKVSEQWTVNVSTDASLAWGNYGITLRVDGQETAPVQFDPANWATTATNIQNALETLPNVGAGVTVTHVSVITASGGAVTEFTVDFLGERNLGNRFDVDGDVVKNPASAVLSATRKRRGEPGGEDVISSSRGWPRCGLFFQQRLVMAGLAAKPAGMMFSRTGEFYDFNLDFVAASGAVLQELDSDGGETILHMALGRHLVVFTDQGEYYVADRVIDQTQPMNLVKSSAIGISARTPVVEQEGALIFVNREGTMVHAAQYDDVRQAYVPDPLSLLATHLMDGLEGAALEKSSQQTDADRLWLQRSDGLLLCGALMRNQDVTGFTRWPTDGLVRDVLTDGLNKVWLVVERQIAGAADLVLESMDPTALFDQSINQSHDPAATVIGNLTVLEGAQVWADCDGYIEGPFTVSGGQITVPFAASNTRVGRWTAPRVRTLPPPRNVSDRVVIRRPVRVHTIELDCIDTTSLAIRANDGPVQEVVGQGQVSGTAPDQPLPGQTGLRRIGGLKGHTPDGICEITQVRPGRLQIRNWAYSAKM